MLPLIGISLYPSLPLGTFPSLHSTTTRHSNKMASAAAAITAALPSLSLRPRPPLHRTFVLKPLHITTLPSFSSSSSLRQRTLPKLAARDDIDTSFFDNVDPNSDITFDPPAPPEGYVPPPAFDELPPESESEIAAAYEEIYGPVYSGVSVLGNDIYVLDKSKKYWGFDDEERERPNDGLEERVVQVRRVTKVVKGGKNLNFRAVIVVGDKKGQVGVGVGRAREVADAIIKSAFNARRNIITVPITKSMSFPHRADGKYGAAKVMLKPAAPGSGVVAGGTVKAVLELAGLKNARGKQLGSRNALNNARATLAAIQKMKLHEDVARERGIPVEQLYE